MLARLQCVCFEDSKRRERKIWKVQYIGVELSSGTIPAPGAQLAPSSQVKKLYPAASPPDIYAMALPGRGSHPSILSASWSPVGHTLSGKSANYVCGQALMLDAETGPDIHLASQVLGLVFIQRRYVQEREANRNCVFFLLMFNCWWVSWVMTRSDVPDQFLLKQALWCSLVLALPPVLNSVKKRVLDAHFSTLSGGESVALG